MRLAAERAAAEANAEKPNLEKAILAAEAAAKGKAEEEAGLAAAKAAAEAKAAKARLEKARLAARPRRGQGWRGEAPVDGAVVPAALRHCDAYCTPGAVVVRPLGPSTCTSAVRRLPPLEACS